MKPNIRNAAVDCGRKHAPTQYGIDRMNQIREYITLGYIKGYKAALRARWKKGAKKK